MAKGKGRKDEMTVQDFLEGGVALAWALSEALGAVHVAIVAVLQYGDRVEQFREMADLVQAVAKEHGQEMLRLGRSCASWRRMPCGSTGYLMMPRGG
jgi:hypothetical protein